MTKRSLLGFLLLFLIITDSVASIAHRCNHDKILGDYKPTKGKISKFERKYRQFARQTASPIRIVLDTSNLRSTGQEREFIISIMGKIFC